MDWIEDSGEVVASSTFSQRAAGCVVLAAAAISIRASGVG